MNPEQPESSQPQFPAPPDVYPKVIIDGQEGMSVVPFQPPEIEQMDRPSKWRYFYYVLGVLQLLGIGLFLAAMLYAMQQAKAGVSGTEFIAMFLFFTVVPATCIVALINLIGLPLYLRRHRHQGRKKIFWGLSLFISFALVGYAIFSVANFYMISRREAAKSLQASTQSNQQFAQDNAKPEITKEEAINLLTTCQLKGFYYTNQTTRDGGNWGNLSKTGVVLTRIKGQPYRISIADSLIAELVPIARQAQKTCNGGAQFWHDGNYEQSKDGQWFFNGTVVNDLSKDVRTKDEAITLLSACKVDYFVGQTGDPTVTTSSTTKSWLNLAEKSTTGIAVSENAPRTYILASKAMTTQLQDTVRQYGKSCYKTRVLSIAIDNWLENIPPSGTGTRVKQAL